MNICAACVHSQAQVADQMLRDGATQAAVAKFLRLDRQVVGRHVRRGHVAKGNPTHGSGWSKPEHEDDIEEMPEAFGLAVEDLIFRLHAVGPAAVAEHRRHQAANIEAQDWQANVDDDCPAARAMSPLAVDDLFSAAERFAKVTRAPLATVQG